MTIMNDNTLASRGCKNPCYKCLPKDSVVINQRDLYCTLRFFFSLRWMNRDNTAFGNTVDSDTYNPCKHCKYPGKDDSCRDFSAERINGIARLVGLQMVEDGYFAEIFKESDEPPDVS